MTPRQRLNRADLARNCITSALVAIELRHYATALVCCAIAMLHLTYIVPDGAAEDMVRRARERARA